MTVYTHTIANIQPLNKKKNAMAFLEVFLLDPVTLSGNYESVEMLPVTFAVVWISALSSD